MEKLVLAALIAAAVLYILDEDTPDNTDPTTTDDTPDTIMTDLTQAADTLKTPAPCTNMHASDTICKILMQTEAYAPTPYKLDDGTTYTWGYGHHGTPSEIPPGYISKADAYTLFQKDVAQRGEAVVKQYVSVPLTQNQFDALVSIAFNMSPRSFAKFAAQVNAGNGIDAIADESVTWVNPKYTNGIRNRRTLEKKIYDTGAYA